MLISTTLIAQREPASPRRFNYALEVLLIAYSMTTMPESHHIWHQNCRALH